MPSRPLRVRTGGRRKLTAKQLRFLFGTHKDWRGIGTHPKWHGVAKPKVTLAQKHFKRRARHGSFRLSPPPPE